MPSSSGREKPIKASNENVELYRRVIEAWNDGGVEGVLPFYDEEIEIYDPDMPGEGTYRGHDGARVIFAQVMEGFAELEIKEWELIPAGDRVVGLLHTHWHGERRDGIDLQVRDAHVLTFRDGKVVYWRMYLDANEALGDVGLGPEAAKPR